MTDPAAISALAEALHIVECFGDGDTHEGNAGSLLTHPFTPAQRAAIAAVVLTPEVLAEVLAGTGTYDFSVRREDWTPGYRPFMDVSAGRILAALRDAGKEPDHA